LANEQMFERSIGILAKTREDRDALALWIKANLTSSGVAGG
jgi:hypothetical protein